MITILYNVIHLLMAEKWHESGWGIFCCCHCCCCCFVELCVKSIWRHHREEVGNTHLGDYFLALWFQYCLDIMICWKAIPTFWAWGHPHIPSHSTLWMKIWEKFVWMFRTESCVSKSYQSSLYPQPCLPPAPCPNQSELKWLTWSRTLTEEHRTS